MDPVKRTPEKTTDVGKTGFCITESFSFGKLFSWKDGITMGKNYFTDEQVRELEKNPYVISVTTKSVNYSEDFKELFLKDYNAGTTPDEIIERLQHQNHVLRQENDFLKRVRSINRRQLSKMQKNKP